VVGPRTPPIHLVLSLYAREARFLGDATATLRAHFAAAGLTEHARHDAHLLDELDMVHFGYRDGIAQPQIDGGPAKAVPDSQPKMPAGDLLLGRDYVNSFNGNYGTDLPGALVDNATYGAFRILGQHVADFEALLERWAQASGTDKEHVAAKIMGRWRNGAPLVLSPDSAHPDPPLTRGQLNDFDYVASTGPPAREGDPDGLRCPVGSHIRRLNPRSGPVIGMPNTRRLVRRNMPYGPEYVDGEADDAERGLIGYFLCGDLEAQWEFVQRMWVNDDFATRGVRGTREPLGGAQLPDGGAFVIPTPDGPCRLEGLHDLVQTRGSLYCLLPGIGGLRHLASLGDAAGSAR
jgi:deferrochelatase/peroxidase EfeB